jgi:hypothetical protein
MAENPYRHAISILILLGTILLVAAAWKAADDAA